MEALRLAWPDFEGTLTIASTAAAAKLPVELSAQCRGRPRIWVDRSPRREAGQPEDSLGATQLGLDDLRVEPNREARESQNPIAAEDEIVLAAGAGPVGEPAQVSVALEPTVMSEWISGGRDAGVR
jgi:hypothetical protein